MQPASFALVMATGIVSIAAHLQGLHLLASALFVLNAAAWACLWVMVAVRAARHRGAFAADFADHARAPGFFTAPAATAVLASQLLIFDHATAAAAVLGTIAAVLWLALTYTIFTALTVRAAKPKLESAIGGTWLLAVVSTQSLAVVAALFAAHAEPRLALRLNFAALCFWSAGGALYTWLIALIFYRFVFLRFTAGDFVPTSWINMGAMAISALAGALLALNAEHAPMLAQLQPFIKGFTLLFWATGSWWIPLLLALAVWEHGVRRHPLRYAPQWWGAVFPLGMYSACTHQIAHAMRLPFLAPVATAFFWLALAAWGAVFAGLLRCTARRFLRAP